MPWLSYCDDELARFHPEFESAAMEALTQSGLGHSHEWIHHHRTPGNSLVPDFVLCSRRGNQWVLAVEIKRTREAVYSTRYQMQAKSYAETNQALYPPVAPRFFAITNMEVTILFALNQGRPPLECRLQNGVFDSGLFGTQAAVGHRRTFVNQIAQVVETVTAAGGPTFDVVWPGVMSDLLAYAGDLPMGSDIQISEPTTPNWHLVRDYFLGSNWENSSRLFILRCLMCEYLRGLLLRHGHPNALGLPPIQPNHPGSSTATAIETLRQIDFHVMFPASESGLYRALSDPRTREVLGGYVGRIALHSRRVVELARNRVDAWGVIESLMTTIYPVETQADCGKVTTDPELAAILATLAIGHSPHSVLDPCCGDGSLLCAAYDRLRTLGLDHQVALAAVSGIEADPIAARLASVRLALKEPAAIALDPPISITQGDMFAHRGTLARANLLLMNPPFKRYETQDESSTLASLRRYYTQAIEAIDGRAATASNGQPNLYSFYVEYLSRTAHSGARIGLILDNKWYHNKYARSLRDSLLSSFQIDAVVEYPHSAFLSSWMIATSLLLARKTTAVDPRHTVRFIRCKVDPRGVDLNALLAAYEQKGAWPTDWTCQLKLQRELSPDKGWKTEFAEGLVQDYRRSDWPTLDDLFAWGRRGSLEKEGGGIGVLEFPFQRPQYGPRRLRKQPPLRPFQTTKGQALTREQNEALARLADAIPTEYRGWALRNADKPQHYRLVPDEVVADQTVEPPSLRALPEIYRSRERSPWTAHHDAALAEMKSEPAVAAYVAAIETVVNVNEDVLAREELWNALREPTAGELIIPRKTRSGHRVHTNPFALNSRSRQVRVSSNFISYSGCTAADLQTGLDQEMAVTLIAAFLVSSFGQLQFEMEGYNREGLLALEKTQLSRIRVFDPRWVRPVSRSLVLAAFSELPYPIRTDRLSASQSERNRLDTIYGYEIAARFPEFDANALTAEVHTALDEWLTARQP
jgi:hypothetical protein